MDSTHLVEVQRLFLKHSGLIKGFVLGLVPHADLAEDVFQEVFLIVNHHAEKFTLGTDFPAWTRAIARRKVLEAYHRKSPLKPMFSSEVALELLATADRLDDDWDDRKHALKGCLNKVAARAREIIELRYTDGLGPTEIAERVSWTPGAVNVMLAKTRQFLRECLGRQFSAQETG